MIGIDSKTKFLLRKLSDRSLNELYRFHSIVMLQVLSNKQKRAVNQLNSVILSAVHAKDAMPRIFKDSEVEDILDKLRTKRSYRGQIVSEVGQYMNDSGLTAAKENFAYMVELMTDDKLYKTSGMRIPLVYPYNSSRNNTASIYGELIELGCATNISEKQMSSNKADVKLALVLFVLFMLVQGFLSIANSEITTSAFVYILCGAIFMPFISFLIRLPIRYIMATPHIIYTGVNDKLEVNVNGKAITTKLSSLDAYIPDDILVSGDLIGNEERELIVSLINKLLNPTIKHRKELLGPSTTSINIDADDAEFNRQAVNILRRIRNVWLPGANRYAK